MHAKIVIAIVLTAIVATSISCGRERSISDKILHENVTIPYNGLLKLKNRKSILTDSSNNVKKWTIVNFIGKKDCSQCTLFKLGLWDKMSSLMRSENFDSRIIFILRISANEYESMSETFRLTNQDYEVYVDTFGLFTKKNPWMTTDNKSLTFIIDSVSCINFIGNPIKNENKEREFINFIKANSDAQI